VYACHGKFKCPLKKYKPPIQQWRGGEEKEREGERRHWETPTERERKRKGEKAAAIKQISTGVRLAGRCGHREY